MKNRRTDGAALSGPWVPEKNQVRLTGSEPTARRSADRNLFRPLTSDPDCSTVSTDSPPAPSPVSNHNGYLQVGIDGRVRAATLPA